jgi:hypothetical protein
VAAVSIAAWLATAPVSGSAAEDEPTAAPEEAAPASEAPPAAAAESNAEGEAEAEAAPAPAPVQQEWYDPLVHNANIGVDLIVVRPLSAVTLAVGTALFVPAAIMTSPNGWDSVKDAYQRFIDEPVEYFARRPLGEF